jgi:hypothetical protein
VKLLEGFHQIALHAAADAAGIEEHRAVVDFSTR